MNNALISRAEMPFAEIALCAFNRRPSRYLHRSRREDFVTAPLSDFLFDGTLAHPHLSDYMLRKTNLDDITPEDIGCPAVRIAMQRDEARLTALACKIGLMVIGQPIRLAISGKEIDAWTEALGQPLFQFVCRHAPLLDTPPLTTKPAGPAPHPGNITMHSAAAGWQFLDAASFLVDASIGQRLRFQLPRESACGANPAPKIALQIAPHHQPEVWTWIDRIWNCMPMRVSPLPAQNPAAYK